MTAVTVRTYTAFIKRDWLATKSYKLPFVMSLMSSIFVLIILYEVGKLIDSTSLRSSSQLGHGYFSFVVLGMAVMQMVHSALQSFATQLRQEQTTGTLEALVATPVSSTTVVLGTAMYQIIQASCTALMFLLLGLALGLRVVLNPVTLLASVVALVGLIGLFIGLGVLVAAFTVVFKRGTTLSAMISSGLALLSGVYFPVASLPSGLRWLAQAVPLTWGLNALREALLFGKINTVDLFGLAAGAAVTLAVSLWLFRMSVTTARRRGSLGQY